jgi:hypothetical protein
MAVLPPPITIIAETPPKALAGLARGRAWCRRPVTVRELGWPANLQLSKFHNGGQWPIPIRPSVERMPSG